MMMVNLQILKKILRRILQLIVAGLSNSFGNSLQKKDMHILRIEEMDRLTVEEFRQAKKLPLRVVLDNVRSMHNVGSSVAPGVNDTGCAETYHHLIESDGQCRCVPLMSQIQGNCG